MKLTGIALVGLLAAAHGVAIGQGGAYDGLANGIGDLYKLSNAKTFSIGPKNLTGEKGRCAMAKLGEGSASDAARDLGQGWKVNPYIVVKPGQTFTLAEINGAGAIQHIWMTPTGDRRLSILRMYWDDEKDPSVEVPVGDFFAMGWDKYAPINSLAVCVNPVACLIPIGPCRSDGRQSLLWKTWTPSRW